MPKREVDIEVIDGDNIPGDDIGEDEEGDDEIIVPAVEGDEEPETEEEEPEEPESEPEAEPEEVPVEEPRQPKPVEGETPRERAYRKEIERLRGEKRKAAHFPVEQQAKASAEVDAEYEKLKESYSADELAQMEKAIDVLAQKKGYVKREHSYREMVNSVTDDFVADHDEYSLAKDTDDLRWNTFQRILGSDYNIQGKSARQLKTIFEKVHRDVQVELGETTPSAPKAPDPKKLEAARQKVASASHAGGTKSATIEPKKKVDTSKHIGGVMFKGFEDDDF